MEKEGVNPICSGFALQTPQKKSSSVQFEIKTPQKKKMRVYFVKSAFATGDPGLGGEEWPLITVRSVDKQAGQGDDQTQSDAHRCTHSLLGLSLWNQSTFVIILWSLGKVNVLLC